MDGIIHYISALLFITFILYTKLNNSLFLIQIFNDDTVICKDIYNNKVINFDFDIYDNKTLIKYNYKDKIYTNFNNDVLNVLNINETQLGFNFYISTIYLSFVMLVFLDYLLNKTLSHLKYSFNIFANQKDNFTLLKYLAPFFILYYKIIFLDLESKNISLLSCIIYLFWFSHYLFFDIFKNSFLSSFIFETISIILSIETLKLNDFVICSFYNDNLIFLIIFTLCSVIINRSDYLLKNLYKVYNSNQMKKKFYKLYIKRTLKTKLNINNYFYIKVFLKLFLVIFFIFYFRNDFILVTYMLNNLIYYYIYYYMYKHIKFEQNKENKIKSMFIEF